VSGTPTWFGGAGHPLLGWIHQPPSAKVRGAVVICPPFGMEFASTYATLRVLADRLADEGLLAMRFDYACTGDSAGDYREPGQLDRWLDSVAEAVAYVGAAGAPTVSIVGLRMGALLAVHALPRCGSISQLVLWDPCVSGKAYLREQSSLYRLKVGPGEPETPDALTPGMVFSPDTVRDLRALELTDADTSRAQVTTALLMLRPQRVVDAAIVAMAARPDVDVVEATEQVALMDVPSQEAAVPHATLDVITEYLAQRATSPAAITECKLSDEAVVAVTPEGQSIVERFDRVGPRGLFAITTMTDDLAGPTIVCVSQANAHRVGPARLWPEMARAAAARGVRTVRYDRRSVGGSPADADAVPRHALGTGRADAADGATLSAYSDEAVEDLADVVTATCPDQSMLALVGVCSGAWVATVAAAIDVRPHSVYLVNLGVWRRRPPPGAMLELPAGQSATQQSTADDQAPPGLGLLRDRIRRLVPYALRLSRGRLGSAQVPELLLAPVVKRGTAVTLLFGPWDAANFARVWGLPAVPRLKRRGTLSVVVDPLIEHSLVSRAGRDLVGQRILDEVAALAGR
jgi:alpha/beta superfamily hydrolase